MQLTKSKKGFSAAWIIGGVVAFIFIIIGLVLVFNIFGNTSSTVTGAMTTASDSGLPLAGILYSSKTGAAGYIYVLLPFIMIAGVILAYMKLHK